MVNLWSAQAGRRMDGWMDRRTDRQTHTYTHDMDLEKHVFEQVFYDTTLTLQEFLPSASCNVTL